MIDHLEVPLGVVIDLFDVRTANASLYLCFDSPACLRPSKLRLSDLRSHFSPLSSLSCTRNQVSSPALQPSHPLHPAGSSSHASTSFPASRPPPLPSTPLHTEIERGKRKSGRIIIQKRRFDARINGEMFGWRNSDTEYGKQRNGDSKKRGAYPNPIIVVVQVRGTVNAAPNR